MKKYNVIKYGGSNLVDANGIKKIISFIKQDQVNIFVVSAMKNITNRLENASSGKDSLISILNYHDRIAFDLGLGFKYVTNRFIGYITYDLEKTRLDLIQSLGELFSSYLIFGYLKSQGINVVKPSGPLMVGTPDLFNLNHSLKSVQNYLDKNSADVHIIEGYASICDSTFRSNIGREGSDLTAVVVASVVDSDLVLIKDVGGLYTDDPKLNTDAKLISEISLSNYMKQFSNSNIIYQRAARYALKLDVSLRIRGNEGDINTTLYSH